MTLQTLILRYAAFAVVAAIANLATQRRGRAPSRIIFDDDGHRDRVAGAAVCPLSDDCPPISLQRLEPHMDDADVGWHGDLFT